MACPERVCDLSALSVVLSGQSGSYTFNSYVDEGDLVEYGETEFDINKQYNNDKTRSRVTGQSRPTMTVTLNLFPCDPEFEALYQAHIRNTLLCFDALVVNDPCCETRRFEDVTIESMTPPNVSADTTVAPITLMGIPVQ